MAPEAKASPARWRSTPRQKGLAGIGQGPRGVELTRGGQVIIHVAPVLERERLVTGWYWYGLGMNTSSSPRGTLEEAKAEANDFYKAQKLSEGK